MSELEKLNLEKREKTRNSFFESFELKDFFRLICANADLAVTPMAGLNSIHTTLSIFFWNLLTEIIALIVSLWIYIEYFFSNDSSYETKLLLLLFMPIDITTMIIAIALDLLINLASFITRPIATLVYLAIPESTLSGIIDNNDGAQKKLS